MTAAAVTVRSPPPGKPRTAAGVPRAGTFGDSPRGRAPAPGTKSRARSELGSKATTAASRSAPFRRTVVVVLPATTCAFVTACSLADEEAAPDRQQRAAPGARDPRGAGGRRLCEAGHLRIGRKVDRSGGRRLQPGEESGQVGRRQQIHDPARHGTRWRQPLAGDPDRDGVARRRSEDRRDARRQQAADQPHEQDDVRGADDGPAGHVERPQRARSGSRGSASPRSPRRRPRRRGRTHRVRAA